MKVDTYTFFARVCPVLILFMPVLLAVYALFPETLTLSGIAIGTTGLLAVSFFLGQVGRDRGFEIQNSLFRGWGGVPTTQLLRHFGASNTITLQRYHKKLSQLLQKPFPSKADEQQAPHKADELYEAAVTLLRQKTRNPKEYPLVFKENTNYGFRRNLLACKPAGIAISALGAAATTSVAIATSDAHLWATAVICVMLLTLWLLRVNSDWVKIPAFAYARALLEASESL